jgi:predicted anti-sigma-YlaC factor YlaD
MNEHLIVHDLLDLAAADALDPAQVKRVEEHLKNCEICRTEFRRWNRIAGSLKQLPTPQASPKLVLRTRRLLEAHSAARREYAWNRLMIGFLLLFSWAALLLNWPVVRLLGNRLNHWLGISASLVTNAWIAYLVTTWLVTAVVAGMLGKRSRQEGKTI